MKKSWAGLRDYLLAGTFLASAAVGYISYKESPGVSFGFGDSSPFKPDMEMIVYSDDSRDTIDARIVYELGEPLTRIDSEYRNKIALLMNADSNVINTEGRRRFRKNISFMEESLERAGFDQIYVLQGIALSKNYAGSMRRESVEHAFDVLKKSVTKDDLLLLYVTNHGFSDSFGSTFISLDDKDTLSVNDFVGLYSGIKSRLTVLFAAPCKAYDLASRMAGENIIAVSASSPGKNSAGSSSIAWATAIGGQDTSGYRIDADINKDSIISWYEIFSWAAENNYYTMPIKQRGDDPWDRKETNHVISKIDIDDAYLRK